MRLEDVLVDHVCGPENGVVAARWVTQTIGAHGGGRGPFNWRRHNSISAKRGVHFCFDAWAARRSGVFSLARYQRQINEEKRVECSIK